LAAPVMSFLRWLAFGTAMLTAIAGAGWSLRRRRYRRVFRIPARRDDTLACRGAHTTFPVSIESDGLAWPAGVVRRGQTAFLTLTTEAKTLGSVREPFIEVRQGSTGYRQYFERGVAGRRHLNLSPLFASRGDTVLPRIELRGGSMRWEREGTLTLFEPPAIHGAEILVLAPHPDDADIATFGLYARRHSWIVTVTAGERGTSDYAAVLPHGAATSRWSAMLRVWDSIHTPQLGDIPPERCVNLVYPDGRLEDLHHAVARGIEIACENQLSRLTLRSRNRAPEFHGGGSECTWNGLVAELRRVLDKTKPDIVLCPHPLIDGHPDHVFTSVALEEAARGGIGKELLFLLYVVHVRDAPVYPFGPAEGWVSLPPRVEDEWRADSVYSHPLGPDLQQLKYFAVECNHDEKTYSNGGSRTVAGLVTAIKRELGAFLGGTGLRPTSFLRRAPRPNEIFWVVSAKTLSEFVKLALARYPAIRG
jgi:LmbE family N-acetylglucosaminyl deacetylase